MGERCGTCRFWLRNAVGEPRFYDDGEPLVIGRCTRYPPTSVVRHPDLDPDWVRPVVLADNRCGEWQPANPGTVSEGAATLARLVLLGDLTAARALADKLREE